MPAREAGRPTGHPCDSGPRQIAGERRYFGRQPAQGFMDPAEFGHVDGRGAAAISRLGLLVGGSQLETILLFCWRQRSPWHDYPPPTRAEGRIAIDVTPAQSSAD